MIITKNLSGSYMFVTLLFLANDIIVVEETRWCWSPPDLLRRTGMRFRGDRLSIT